jgi:hypothetical protein
MPSQHRNFYQVSARVAPRTIKTGSAVRGVAFYSRTECQASLLALMVAVLLMLSSLSAHAALGGNASSITSDHTAVGGTLTTTQRSANASVNAVGVIGVNSLSSTQSSAAYTVTTITTDLGTTINEYQTANGVVFAISWSGPAVPNLGQLLGTHVTEMRAGAAANAAAGNTHGPMTMDNGDLVVFSGGMMQAYHGLAYLKSAMPAGVTTANLH